MQAACEVVLESIERERADVLNALFELYVHDFSEHAPFKLKESGRFEVSAGELWWTRDDHHPFFVRVAGRLAGFALVSKGSKVADDPAAMDVAEFFVVRGERGKRVGQQAALALLGRFPGRWEIRVRQSNPRALKFWSRVLEVCSGRKVDPVAFSAHGADCHVLRAEVR
jgi:predicted acetyltransferase